MTNKKIPIFLVVVFIVVCLIILALFGKQKEVTAPSQTDLPQTQNQEASKTPPALYGKDDVLKAALNLYIVKKQAGVDFKNGPCLGLIASDWVLDIAHSPRIAADDKPENQCPQLKNGQAHHFIELDPDGKLLNSY